MDKDEEALIRNKAVEFHRILDFLDSAGVKLKCELCGSEDFGIRHHIEGAFVPVLTFLNETGQSKPSEIHVGYIQAICQRCGNTKLFEKSIVEQWIEQGRHG
jgi:predicted nucleic-acid-binding Zn-ribbon protein